MQNKQSLKQKGFYNLDVVEISRRIRKDLKNEFGKTIKFSVTTRRYPSHIVVLIKEVSKEYILSIEEVLNETEYYWHDKDYYKENYSSNTVLWKIKSSILEKVRNIIDEYNYDESDIMTDYFETNFTSEVRANYTII